MPSLVALPALALLAACSSGNGTNSTGGTVSEDDSETSSPQAESNEPGSELIGLWVLCNENGGFHIEYEFTATTYANSVGRGNCDGFEDDSALENAGPYAITGTSMSDSGLTAYTMELTTRTLNGMAIFESLIERRHRLAYTGTPDQLVFFDDTRDEDEPSLTLDFDNIYTKIR